MTKISNKFKKVFCLILILTISLLFSSCDGCGNKGTKYPDGIDITVGTDLQPYFLYSDQLPVLHFDYNGVVAEKESNGAAYFFVKNDQYELSDHFAAHLAMYNNDQIYVVSCEDQKYDSGKAKFGSDSLPLDETIESGNEQKYSKEYQIVCWTNEGTRYSYQYRTFVSNSKRYYIYRYSSNIGISLEESLMVIKVGDQRKLLLLALPYNTKYEVGAATIKLDSLVNKDTYLDEKYYKFAYPTYVDEVEFIPEEQKTKAEIIKDWYIKYCNGKDEGGIFTFTYCGAKYQVDFDITDAGNSRNQEGFKITYLGAA